MKAASNDPGHTGDELLTILEALANPHRLTILSKLSQGRRYVSDLAREMGMSRPLLYMHLKRLEKAGLVSSELELSADGRAMKFYSLNPFDIRLMPETVAEAARSLTDRSQSAQPNQDGKEERD